MPQFVVMVIDPESQGGVLGGGDYESRMHRRDFVQTSHSREISAEHQAKKLAALNPGKQYGVFGIRKIFETAKPVYIEKTVNDAGEIVVVPADGPVPF